MFVVVVEMAVLHNYGLGLGNIGIGDMHAIIA